MVDEKRTINEGYVPEKVERGYQPATQTTGDSKPKSGYVPATSGGDNPTNDSSPPGDE
ncbi:hypothetical protein GCM10007421_15610 [Halopseudomonas oceani]|uniref:hypothetical protein n=1 Tax=Halopseudomonas oceani TaxID=1708783 RepID=UPI00147324C2|nr:hypothetical protein [Halopseudomonas oceani]GGE42346.1 hypothetical protein GCM10007421_15610 [Halopseudomonas oceani]